jgi:hypothetical protein
VAINLTGYNVRSKIVDSAGAPVGAWLTSISTPASGIVFMFLPDGVSDLLTSGCKYDVEIWKNLSIPELSVTKPVVSTVLAGTFTITNDITDDETRTPG